MRETLRRLPGADILRELRERSYFYRAKKINPNGFLFVGNKKMQDGQFENDIVLLIKKLVTERNYKNFIDIGAHHGYFSCLAHTLGLTVYSVEPNPLNYSILKRNFRINQIDQIHTFNLALGNANAEIEMFGFGTGFSIHKNWARDVSKKRKMVPMRTLDGLEIDLSDSLVKIDVEGAETKVLEGGISKLQSSRNIFVIMEVSDVISRTPANNLTSPIAGAAVELLINQGFLLMDLNDNNELSAVPKTDYKKYLARKLVNDSTNLFFQKVASGL